VSDTLQVKSPILENLLNTKRIKDLTLQVKSPILENLLQHQENKRPEKRGIRSNLNNHKELNRFNV